MQMAVENKWMVFCCLVVCQIFCLVVSENSLQGKNGLESPVPSLSNQKNITMNSTVSRNISSPDHSSPMNPVTFMKQNKDMLKRGFFVLLAVTAVIVIYFGVRFYRTRRRKVKRYGLLGSGGEHVELNPIESDSDDDYTVFETKTLK